MSYRDRIRAFLRFAYHASLRSAQLKPDLVFATSTPLTIALPAVFAAWRNKVPMVLEVRDLWPELPIAVGALRHPIAISSAHWLERFAYRHAAHIIALSPGMRDGVAAAGYPADRITVIPNAADLDLFTAEAQQIQEFRKSLPMGDRPIVTYAGTLGRINGVAYLARIAAASREAGGRIAFLVAGHGGEKMAIESLARDLGVLDDNFFMIDPIPKADMPLLLGASDVALSLFVNLPEMWHNSANKFFDALASGTPIAINYQGWQAQLLTNSGAGIVLPPDDPTAAAHMLIHVTNDSAWMGKAGVAARKLAESRFSRDMLYQEFEKVLLEAAREGRQ